MQSKRHSRPNRNCRRPTAPRRTCPARAVPCNHCAHSIVVGAHTSATTHRSMASPNSSSPSSGSSASAPKISSTSARAPTIAQHATPKLDARDTPSRRFSNSGSSALPLSKASAPRPLNLPGTAASCDDKSPRLPAAPTE